MATTAQIRNPLEWGWDQLKQAQQAVEATGHALGGADGSAATTPALVRRIGMDDLRLALRLGMADFAACRTPAGPTSCSSASPTRLPASCWCT